MKKIFIILVFFSIFLFFGKTVNAQGVGYIINSFDSNITINQNASITVEERIDVNFSQNLHGIYRTIPSIYRSKDKIINSSLRVISVLDEKGNRYMYQINRVGDDVQIKIGDPNKLIIGQKVYIIKYNARSIIQRFEDHDELYWNVVGSNWNTKILKASATINSDYADINDKKCYLCNFSNFEKKSANAISSGSLGNSVDMTIVLALDKNNNLNFNKSLTDYFNDYWGYGFATLPMLVMVIAWYKKGRDLKHVGDNIYFQNKNSKTETVSLFAKREFLPTVYSPIDNLTPSQVGAILNQKIAIKDIVSEIAELGRLGFLEISKIDKKWAIDDYEIKRTKNTKENENKLVEYQKYLLDSLFELGSEKNKVLLSELKQNFYKKLEKFKELLNDNLKKNKYIYESSDIVVFAWFVIVIGLTFLTFYIVRDFMSAINKEWPTVILGVSSAIAFYISTQMPRRAPLGYSMYRQILGLKHYISVGKWRQEIAEKQLFLKDMLPLAISLGVVSRLARDMQDLGVKPPSYFHTNSIAWAGSFNSFTTSAGSSMIGSSKSSSFSGGSGFSGGGGGGFGGGGGGSW